jgi:hypothetical protein
MYEVNKAQADEVRMNFEGVLIFVKEERTAENAQKAKFAKTEFYEVAPQIATIK